SDLDINCLCPETSKPCVFLKILCDLLFCRCYDAGSVCDI
uniref:Uncharacterized protein n=1 Tax=Aegilops tauschii subsp. strangulata TaxID=200361 RepID=A0A453E235_AEGTS